MPTIIKRGSDPRKAQYRLTCETCRTEAVFEPHEVKHDQRDGDSWIECPVCQKGFGLRSPQVQRVAPSDSASTGAEAVAKAARRLVRRIDAEGGHGQVVHDMARQLSELLDA